MASVVGSSFRRNSHIGILKNMNMNTLMTNNWWWRDIFSHTRGEK